MNEVIGGVCGLFIGSIIVIIAYYIYYRKTIKRMEQERKMDLMQQHIDYLKKDRDKWMNKCFELELGAIKSIFDGS